MEILDLNNDEDTKTTDEMEPKKPEEKTSPVKEILSWVLTIAFAIVAAILIKNYVIINANIPSGSMENTIQIGDDIFGFRLAYTFSDPKRGDIVIFNAPDSPSEKYIKRVIGLPGLDESGVLVLTQRHKAFLERADELQAAKCIYI